MSYKDRHWRGELSLAKSFWINVVLISAVIRGVLWWLKDVSPIEDPILGFKVFIIIVSVKTFVIYPWQIAGVWRSATRHEEERGASIWINVVRVLVVLGLILTPVHLLNDWPIYKAANQLGFGKDPFGIPRLELLDDGSIVHLEGRLGFGSSRKVRRILAQNSAVKGIILDSPGGRIQESRQLFGLIEDGGLDTYTLKGCYSACGLVFIAGRRRYLGQGANLGFHGIRSWNEGLKRFDDSEASQDLNRTKWRKRGINEDFIDRIYKPTPDDVWYPTVEEMFSSGVIHGIVNQSDLTPVDYGSFASNDLEEIIGSIPAFKTIKRHEPETYGQMVAEIELLMRKGASEIEAHEEATMRSESLVYRLLPSSSDRALIGYVSGLIELLRDFNKKDPILCMKVIFPKEYGSLEYTKHMSTEQRDSIITAMGLLVTDSHELKVPDLDSEAAEEFFAEILTRPGDDARYLHLQPKEMVGRQDYSRSCEAFLKFYELILAKDSEAAGNGLRYALSR